MKKSTKIYSYSKRPLWQWLLLYFVIGGIIYVGIYSFFFKNKGYNYSTSTTPQYPQETDQSYTNTDNTPQNNTTNQSTKSNQDLEQLAQTTMTHYLGKYKNSSLPDEEKILDYVIEHIENVHMNNQELRFYVTYSVKTAHNNTPSNWQAGNGTIEKDGWVKNKSNFVTATKLNNEYYVKELATGVPGDF